MSLLAALLDEGQNLALEILESLEVGSRQSSPLQNAEPWLDLVDCARPSAVLVDLTVLRFAPYSSQSCALDEARPRFA
jgi:hypothetical protein